MNNAVKTTTESDFPDLSVETLLDPLATSNKSDCSRRMVEAMSLSIDIHALGVPKNLAFPFIAHPWAAAALVSDYGASENEVIAALLYNGMIYHPDRLPLSSLHHLFGEVVVSILGECRDEAQNHKEFVASRKLRSLRSLMTASRSAKIVSLAHKVQSVRTLVMRLQQQSIHARGQFNIHQSLVLQHHRELIHALRLSWPHPLINALEAAIQEVARLK